METAEYGNDRHGQKGGDKIGSRAGKSDEDFPFPPIAEISRIDHNRLGPAESGDKKHDKADRVNMRNRVQRQPPRLFRRIVSHSNGRAGMRIFVNNHSDN